VRRTPQAEETELPDLETEETELPDLEMELPNLETAETEPPDLETEETELPDLEKEQTEPPNLEMEQTEPPDSETEPPPLASSVRLKSRAASAPARSLRVYLAATRTASRSQSSRPRQTLALWSWAATVPQPFRL